MCAWWTGGASWAWDANMVPIGEDETLNAHGLLKRVDQNVYIQTTS